MKNIKVLSVLLRDGAAGANVPGVGLLKTILNSKHYPGIEMVLLPSGIICKAKGRRFLVPISSCKIIELENGDVEVTA